MSLLIAENVTKNYQVGEIVIPALRGVSFEIDAASFVSFIGPSGSGKTTLLNLIGCLDAPTSGRLTVAGADVGIK
jgi:putative ABC transport system ATP-binding protein